MKFKNHPIKSNKPLSLQVGRLGENNWLNIIEYIRNIPYGRSSVRGDLKLVLLENKGTCSSKHAFLKALASENNIPDVQLILGMYRMQQANTPGIGSALEDTLIDIELTYIPEAHCYLRIDGEALDVTNATSEFSRLEADILEELEIEPEQVGDFKVAFHQDYLKKWLKEQKLEMSFEDLWKIREQCIKNLSE